MSGPVPSPSMKGRMGCCGTSSRPLRSVMGSPPEGIFGAGLAMGVLSRARFGGGTIPDPLRRGRGRWALVARGRDEYLPAQRERLHRVVLDSGLRRHADPRGALWAADALSRTAARRR